MDTTLLLDARLAALCGMLFTTVVALTTEEPAPINSALSKPLSSKKSRPRDE
jgi:hypothetical protein